MALIQFSGLASGIDSSALIEALLSRERQTRIEPLENKISALEDTNSALKELTTLLGTLRTSAESFRTLSGGGVAKLAQSSDESILTTSASTVATRGSYNLTVTQLAAAGTVSFDDRYSSSSSAIYSGMNDGAAAADRTVTIDIGSGSSLQSINIELTSSTTLSEFAASFNSQTSKASASVVNVGTSSAPAYALIIKADETGVSKGSLGISVGAAVTDSGAGAFNSYTLDQAKDATFSIGGVSGSITRSSNTISDVIEGLTFSLQSTGSASINVGIDTDSTTAALKELVDAYNDVVTYITENDTVTSQNSDNGTENIFGSLATTRVDDAVLSALRGAFSSASTSGANVSILADLGIITNRDGTLEFKEETFQDVLSKEPDAVKNLLAGVADRIATTGGVIDQFTRFNGLIGTTINSQNDLVSQYQKEIVETESRLSLKENQLNARFAKLEGIIGKLQNQQSSLSSILGSL